MITLSLTRLAAAGLIAGAAGLTGLILAPRAAPPPAPAPSSVAGGPSPVLQTDIRALSARLRATGLFPAAVPLHDDEANDAETDAIHAAQNSMEGEGMASIAAPPITALVREDRIWRLHAGGVITERARLMEGDELYDGWRVVRIGATHVVLRRGNETRAIHVFEPQGDG